MTTGTLTRPTVEPEARIRRGVIQPIEYPNVNDPTHEKAWRMVEDQEADYATVFDPASGTILFRAWRISSTSWAWQTTAMAAPAFMPYAP